jgi:transcriptional regulator with XRE-family HTH domain
LYSENRMARGGFDVESLGAPQAEVAYRLRSVREAKGLSLREFAKLLTGPDRHVSHTAVMKFEDLELRITPDYLDLVATRTGIPYGWFLSGLDADDVSPSTPALETARLEFLPRYLHRSVTERLEGLADWCGIPPGPDLDVFFRQVGDVIRAPFAEPNSNFRSWKQLTQRELSVYIATQFATLRTLLRRLGEPEDPGPLGEDEGGLLHHGPEIHSEG